MSLFEPYLQRWHLRPDGEAFQTAGSHLLPVLYEGRPAMLKVTREPEERWGAGLMVWWQGRGAAPVLGQHEDALLLARAGGTRSLARMAQAGRDREATQILCRVAGQLHGPHTRDLPELIPLGRWFEALPPAAQRYGGLLQLAHCTAEHLLATPRQQTVLHGELHHGNILDFQEAGWLAIDPKRLYGERTFDFVNWLRNPDGEVATRPGRLASQATLLAQLAGLERRRLLQWLVALTGLSAAWLLEEEIEPTLDLQLLQLAATQLGLL